MRKFLRSERVFRAPEANETGFHSTRTFLALGDDYDERVPLRVSLSSVWEFGFGIGFFYQHFDEHCSVSVELETAKCE